ncbi:uncharacterized protein LOC116286705 [Actinia tenebrosa]|uniref:Uncharacterized protein LOC116286705 n=1 Tax=Actinia tenebrosa TaxID=6105 RepID=A0A6P8H8P3_ACTTE|nr:uncharacterized protein LOC116286705 [Actinia tenebrosa]
MLLILVLCLFFAPISSKPTDGISTVGRPTLSSESPILWHHHDSTSSSGNTISIRYDQEDTSNWPTNINTCKSAILKFNITKPYFKVKRVISADLRVYKMNRTQSTASSTFSILKVLLIDPKSKPYNAAGLTAIGYPVSLHFQGWESFPITPGFEIWLRDASTNHGLLLSGEDRGEPSKNQIVTPLHPNMLGFVGFEGPKDKRPYILVKYEKKRSQNDHEDDGDDEHST